LFEEVVCVSRISPNQEAFEVLVDKPACWGTWNFNQLAMLSSAFHDASGNDLPPKPVANPTVPSEPSSSTQNDPKTLIPQLVLDARYFSHLDIGVEIEVSISLHGVVLC